MFDSDVHARNELGKWQSGKQPFAASLGKVSSSCTGELHAAVGGPGGYQHAVGGARAGVLGCAGVPLVSPTLGPRLPSKFGTPHA